MMVVSLLMTPMVPVPAFIAAAIMAPSYNTKNPEELALLLIVRTIRNRADDDTDPVVRVMEHTEVASCVPRWMISVAIHSRQPDAHSHEMISRQSIDSVLQTCGRMGPCTCNIFQ